MTAYYSENDPFAAAWLRNLIAAGHIAPGVVDERDIRDVKPAELADYEQCHFFAGIGGWSYALRLAGVPDSFRVWTGSCPCQPFSAAGKGGGFDDERHLWPDWFYLIGECHPPVILGEQVASGDGLGWLDLVQADLEGAGYAFAAHDLCAAGIGAPHIRQRLYLVAHADDAGSQGRGERRDGSDQRAAGTRSVAGIMADAELRGREGWSVATAAPQAIIPASDNASGDSRPGPTNGFWRNADWIACRDGKWRAVEPGSFPLAHGVPARVGRLRAYGNAIVPQVAAEFIRAAIDA